MEKVGPPPPIANVRALDRPPPGAGLNTVRLALPCAATSLAGMLAASLEPLTKDVVRSAPFHRTVEPRPKPVPLTVRVKAAAPGVALAGESELRTGTA